MKSTRINKNILYNISTYDYYVIITRTCLNNEVLDNEHGFGHYNIFHTDRGPNIDCSRGGGAMIYVHNTFH